MSGSPQDTDSAAGEPHSITLEIAGRSYRVRSDADEDGLQRVAQAVDDAMRRIRERTDTVDSHDVAVLAALNLAREVLRLRECAAVAPDLENGALRELTRLAEAELALSPRATGS